MVIKSTFERRCLAIAPPTELSFTTASMSIVFILLNIPGNILVIMAVVLDPNKNLRTPFNWLVVNLATTDLIVGVITEPLVIYYHIKEGLKKNFRIPEEFIAIHMVYFISCAASVLSLSSLAVERFLAVKQPNMHRRKVTSKRIVITILMIWLISLSLPNIYLKVRFTAYAFIFTNTFMALGMLILSITYTLIKHKVGKVLSQEKRCNTASSSASGEMSNKRSQHRCLSADDTQTNSPYSITRDEHKILKVAANTPSNSAGTIKIYSQEQNQLPNPTVNTRMSSSDAITISRQLLDAKVTEIFLTVLVALLLCYGPSSIMMYLIYFCDDCSCTTLHWIHDIHILLTLLNSSINFFCYALRSTRFRNAFLKLVRINRRRDHRSSSNTTFTRKKYVKGKE